MKKLWLALFAATMLTGPAFAAGEAEKPAAAPPPPNEAPMPPRHPGEFDPSQLPTVIKQNDQLIAQWQARSDTLHTDEAKKVFAQAIAAAKEFRAVLTQLSDAVQAGKQDDISRLAAQLREKRPELLQYQQFSLPTYSDLDQVKSMQAERGKDNPDLNARCQQIIDLLHKRLDLMSQITAVNHDIMLQHMALQTILQSAPQTAPSSAPSAEPTQPAPKPAAKPNELQ